MNNFFDIFSNFSPEAMIIAIAAMPFGNTQGINSVLVSLAIQ